MKQTILLIVLILGCSAGTLFSQNLTKEFKISLPEYKVKKSRYSSIHFIDSRRDSTKMGIVQRGAFNRKANVITTIPISKQLENVLETLTDSSAADGDLLFQLRKLTFAEVTGAMSEKGYCYLKAGLYAKNDSQYRKLGTIDTLILIKSMDVTKPLFRGASQAISDFVANHLVSEGDDSVDYSEEDIREIDRIEKENIVLYTTDSYTDGIYNSYESFSRQTPDKQGEVELGSDGTIIRVKALNAENKMKKIKPKDIYAVVHGGRPFVTTEFGYYPIQKSYDDFYFVGRAKVTANTGDVAAASMFFGVIGGLLASSANATFVMMIDHTNGGFVHIREVKTAQ